MRSYTTATAMLAIWALLTISCGTSPQNANTATSNNSNSMAQLNANGATTPTPVMADPCAGTSIQQKQSAVLTYIGNQVDQMPKLKQQKMDGKFDYRVLIPTNSMYLTVYVGGIMAVNHGSANGLLNRLNTMMDPIMKDGCVMKVNFVSMANLPPQTATSAALADGFEWTSCDYPANPCPDGTCSQACGTVPAPGPPANSNSSNSANKKP